MTSPDLPDTDLDTDDGEEPAGPSIEDQVAEEDAEPGPDA